MYQDLNGQGHANYQQPVNASGNQDPACYCHKHNQEITHFCITTNEPLCGQCKVMQEGGHGFHHGNTPNAQNRPGGLEVKPIHEAIQLQHINMQTKLADMAEFIRAKSGPDLCFPNHQAIENFKNYNSKFDQAYSEAHKLFTQFKEMEAVYQTQNIQAFIHQFKQAHDTCSQFQQLMMPIVQQRMQSVQPAPSQYPSGYHASPMTNNTPQPQNINQQYQQRPGYNQPQYNDYRGQQEQQRMPEATANEYQPQAMAQSGNNYANPQNQQPNQAFAQQQQAPRQPAANQAFQSNQNPAAQPAPNHNGLPAPVPAGQPAGAGPSAQNQFRSLSLKILIELEETSTVQAGAGGPQQIKTLEMQIMPPMNESIKQLLKNVICEELKKYGQIQNYSQIQDMHVYLIEELESSDGRTGNMNYTRLDGLLEQSIENLNLRGAPSLLFSHRKLQVPSYQPHQTRNGNPPPGQNANLRGNLPALNLPGSRPANGVNRPPLLNQGQIKKRPQDVKGGSARSPAGVGGIKKPEDAKKEKRERKNREPKKPETCDIAWRLYQPPKEAQQTPEESEGEEKKEEEADNQINANGDIQNGDANAVQNNEPFSRTVSLPVKARLRDLKREILTQLEMKDMCNLKVYYYASTEMPAGTEEKEIEAAKKDTPVEVGEEFFNTQMVLLQDMGLRWGGKVEVQLMFTINVSVANKGAGYQNKLQVSPNDKMDIIRNKVPFYNMFSSRGCVLYDPNKDRYYENEEINTLLFRDSGLKDNSELQLKAPLKMLKATTPTSAKSEDQGAQQEVPSSDANEDDDNVSMDSDDRAIAEAMLKLQREQAEEGEGEEGECDLDEDDEDAAEAGGEIYQAGSEADKASIADAPEDANNEKAADQAAEE